MSGNKAIEILKGVRDFTLFPCYDACGPGITVTVVAIDVVALIALHRWLVTGQLAWYLAAPVLVLCTVVYLFAYRRYRDPSYRSLLRNSCD